MVLSKVWFLESGWKGKTFSGAKAVSFPFFVFNESSLFRAKKGDEILPSYVGITMKHYKDPYVFFGFQVLPLCWSQWRSSLCRHAAFGCGLGDLEPNSWAGPGGVSKFPLELHCLDSLIRFNLFFHQSHLKKTNQLWIDHLFNWTYLNLQLTLLTVNSLSYFLDRFVEADFL